MQTRKLGKTDIDVTLICLGTMTWGSQNTAEEGHAQMDMALDHGSNFFDTAEMDAVPASPDTSFRTETIIGEWFARTGNRNKVILATKADKLKFGQAKTAMLGIAGKLKPFGCVQHLIMFSATSKRGVDECREALTQWLESEEQAPSEA